MTKQFAPRNHNLWSINILGIVKFDHHNASVRKLSLGPLTPFLEVASIWVVILGLFRFIFSLIYGEQLQFPNEFIILMLNGLRMDLVITSLIFTPIIFIYGFLGLYPQSQYLKIFRQFCIIYLTIFGTGIVFLELATPLYIEEYGVRPEQKFFEYLTSPREVFTMLWGAYSIGIMLIVLFTLLFSVCSYRYLQIFFFRHTVWDSRTMVITTPILFVILFLCARSSLDHRPVNPSSVAFSNSILINNLPLNSFYSLSYSIYRLKDEKDASKIYGEIDKEKMLSIINQEKAKNAVKVDEPATDFKPRNIVIILQESMGARFVSSLGGEDLTPNLVNLSKEGWWFEKLYATGTRSVRGIEAVISGFLPTPARSVVKLEGSQGNFFTLASVLEKYQYESQFFYGGKSHFDNMKSFFLSNGFHKVVDQDAIKNPRYVGSWGASDEDVFEKIHAELMRQNGGKPKFLVMLSTSNHTPFDFPDFQGAENMEKTRENAVRYADYALGTFIEKARISAYWQNTLFLIVADHDLRASDFTKDISEDAQQVNRLFPVQGFHIPGLIIGADIKPKTISVLASQIDLPVTLLALAGITYQTPMIGKDLTRIDDSYEGRAIMQYNDEQAFWNGKQLALLRPGKNFSIVEFDGHQLRDAIQNQQLLETALAHVQWASYSYKTRTYQIDKTLD